MLIRLQTRGPRYVGEVQQTSIVVPGSAVDSVVKVFLVFVFADVAKGIY